MTQQWTQDLADEINNRYSLDLSDSEARKLADLIGRRSRKALGCQIDSLSFSELDDLGLITTS